ncbi:HAD family hydrolase [Pediococcus claussenii]|nr:HAD family phosphatase [Pediococcus claussenii]ANZ69598.1 HAD family hydrolase [Pediococcus claussenii]
MKAYIFDVDGVLINSEKYYHQLRMDFFDSVGEVPKASGLDDLVGRSLDDGWKMMVPDRNKREKLMPEFIKYWKANNIDFPKYVNPYVLEVLTRLKADGNVLAIASAGVIEEIDRMVLECGFSGLFDQIISGESVKHNKPAPDIYIESVKRLRINATRCIAIEDSQHGIAAAKGAGLTTWAVHYPEYHIDQTAADIVFNGFEDINRYITK